MVSGSWRAAWLLTLLGSTVANAQATHTPAPEDAAMVASLLEGRVDVTPERIVHVAPLPGDDGDGSAARPRRDLIQVIARAEAGTAIHLAPGVYDMTAIRDAFGHESSRLKTEHEGEAGRPIVVRTDPEAYAAGETAVLDFSYQNQGNWSSTAFVVAHRNWVFERFEMRRMRRRGFSVNGYRTTLRELHLHHLDTNGRDNDALIVMQASGGMTDNVVVGNHLHHVGNIERETDELIDRGFVNGGCYYSVTRLSYDSEAPPAGHDATRAEWEASLLRADGHAYVIGNHVHDCHYGLGLKNNSRGPYWFLSNVIHDVDYGVFSPFRETIVRNNIIYDAAQAGVQLGRAHANRPLHAYLKMTGNGAHSEVAHNTIVGGWQGMSFRAGWGSTVHHNLVVSTSEPVAVVRNSFAWWEDGSWPGIRGEYLLGDMTPDHPFWEYVPGYVREAPEEYRRMRLDDNCYDKAPVIGRADFTQPIGDVTGMEFDERERILDEAARAELFVDEPESDYRLADPDLPCGSRIGSSPAAPVADAGVDRDAGSPPDAGPPTIDAGAPESPGDSGSGCSCRAAGGDVPAPVLLLLALPLLALRRARALSRK